MKTRPEECCVLNGGGGAWAFDALATQLSSSLKIDISETPQRFNYVLQYETSSGQLSGASFIPMRALELAADKRKLADAFRKHGVPTPKTELLDSFEMAQEFVRANPNQEWCLKFPTSCGGNGHRFITTSSEEHANWPKPFVVQEFIRMARPEVYRVYCAGGEMFGWVARRFPENAKTSPWVAHACGARYVTLHPSPPEALQASKLALKAAGLWDSFGCVDLLQKPDGDWVVLEVGSDGLFNHVDRDLGDARLEQEILQRITAAFWRFVEHQEANS